MHGQWQQDLIDLSMAVMHHNISGVIFLSFINLRFRTLGIHKMFRVAPPTEFSHAATCQNGSQK